MSGTTKFMIGIILGSIAVITGTWVIIAQWLIGYFIILGVIRIARKTWSIIGWSVKRLYHHSIFILISLIALIAVRLV